MRLQSKGQLTDRALAGLAGCPGLFAELGLVAQEDDEDEWEDDEDEWEDDEDEWEDDEDEWEDEEEEED